MFFHEENTIKGGFNVAIQCGGFMRTRLRLFDAVGSLWVYIKRTGRYWTALDGTGRLLVEPVGDVTNLSGARYRKQHLNTDSSPLLHSRLRV